MNRDPLLRFRPELPILEKTTYLISNSLGAMPRGAAGALQEYADVWASRGVRRGRIPGRTCQSRWGTRSLPCSEAAGTVSFLPNVTVASAVVLSSFSYAGRRNRIVTIEGEFPSMAYLYGTLGPRLGAEIVTVPSPGSGGLEADEDRILDAIDDRTAFVALSHVLFKSAFVVDVARVAEKCRRVGAPVVLDVYQSAGTVPVDVEALGVDIAVGGVLKWLCGGPGGAFLYVDPGVRPALSPSLTGWMAHPAPFHFEPPPMRWREDAFRFLLGTPAILALYAAREGARLVRAAGVDAIRESRCARPPTRSSSRRRVGCAARPRARQRAAEAPSPSISRTRWRSRAS